MTNEERVDAMSEQAAAASETELVRRLLIAAANDALLLRVIGNDADYEDIAKTMTGDAIIDVANREFAELDDEQRATLRDAADDHVRKALTRAVIDIWTVCDALKIDPTTVSPDTIALITALRVIPADAIHAVS